ncbi:flavodoxin domain-containing protein [Lacticaseibacillus parakribbianus]|uniref:flavodoxin domain-containing protein n=1 Tax=Lacticaseibacillus parakribbianus TaxID=2970927 RepID=UPI0021CB3A27|nr:flavodoxin domain-containing protein [Lacticaseibacillus parakribbianus]
MAKCLIVYTSQTGFTQQYALWIARQLHCEVVDSKFITRTELQNARLVVYGGHLLWGRKVSGFSRFYRRYAEVLPEHLLVFGTGMLAQSELDLDRVWAHSFAGCTVAPQFFYFRGQVDPKALPVRLRLVFHWTQYFASATAPQPPNAASITPLLVAATQLDDLGLLEGD